MEIYGVWREEIKKGSRGMTADTILCNGKIITMDEKFTIAEAAAIRGGKFVVVGSNKMAKELKGPGTIEIDLGGKIVFERY